MGGDQDRRYFSAPKYDGLFSLSGVPSGRYRIHFTDERFKVTPEAISVGAKDVSIGDIVVRPNFPVKLWTE